MARERAELVRRALDRLPEDYRWALLWRYQETLSFEEIGRLLQRSPNAARKLWARALVRLQQELEPPP
jgi:RNA polymerase sigma factor (sigma-70 family)